MRLIGLTGGIATGKSTFAGALRALGAPVVDADRLAREVVIPGNSAFDAIVATLGREVVGADGALDRKKLGALVFADARARARLEAITHPAIHRAMLDETANLASQGHAIGFYDVPLLYEAGLERDLDCVVLVYAPRAVQVQRVMARDGLTAAEANARLLAQWPIDDKLQRADVVVVNDGDTDALRAKATLLLADLRRGLGKRASADPPRSY